MGRKQKASFKKTARGENINLGTSSQQIAGRKVSLARLKRKLQAISELTGKSASIRKGYHFFKLTPAQLQQIELMAMGMINREIEATLNPAIRKVS